MVAIAGSMMLMPGLGADAHFGSDLGEVLSVVARRVMLPVCQCSSWRPVISTKGKSASGRSLAGMMSAGTSCTRPSGVAKWSMKTMGSPGSSSSVTFRNGDVLGRVVAECD